MCLIIPVPGFIITFGHSAILGVKGVPAWSGWLLVAVPILTILGSAAFIVRGYRISGGMLLILRPGWETRFQLSKLTSARIDPEAFNRSLRLFGNGGFFCFAGWFRNSKLGVYRAYATDAKRAVVLRFLDKTIVVTPDNPEKFVQEIQQTAASQNPDVSAAIMADTKKKLP